MYGFLGFHKRENIFEGINKTVDIEEKQSNMNNFIVWQHVEYLIISYEPPFKLYVFRMGAVS